MKKRMIVKKPSKLDTLATSTMQDYAHISTDDIVRRRIVLACEANATDHEITGLSAKLVDARERRAKIGAVLTGLASVVEKR